MILRYNTDEIDNTIVRNLNINARTPYTEISKQISQEIKPLSVGTVHVRVKKLEDAGIIKGSTLIIGYESLGFHLIAFVGILSDSRESKLVKEELKKIPNIVQLYITSGKYNLFCRIIARDPSDARDVISKIGEIKGVLRTESTICLEESINDENRLLSNILQKHKTSYKKNIIINNIIGNFYYLSFRSFQYEIFSFLKKNFSFRKNGLSSNFFLGNG